MGQAQSSDEAATRAILGVFTLGVSELVMMPTTLGNEQRAKEAALYKARVDELSNKMKAGKIDVMSFRKEVNKISCERVEELAQTVPKHPGTIAVFGRTSAGKSTLLNSMFGLDLPTGHGDTTKDVRVVGVCGDYQVVDVYGSNDSRMYEEEFSLRGIAMIDIGLICSDTDPSGVLFVTNLLKSGKVKKCFYVHTKSGDMSEIKPRTLADEKDFCTAKKLHGPYYTEVSRPETIRALMKDIAQHTGKSFSSRTTRTTKVLISEEYIESCRVKGW